MLMNSEELYDLIYSDKDYKKEASAIKQFISTKFQKAESILDVACGTGKHMEWLSPYYRIDGLDLNERFIEIARKRNPSSHFWCDNMTSFQIGKQYDVVMCLFSSIAYAKTYDLLVQTLLQMKKHLKQGGHMMIEPWFTPETWYPGHITIANGANDEIQVSRMSFSESLGNLSILHFEYLIGTSQGISHISEKHELGLFSTGEMLSAFQDAQLDAEFDPVGISGRGLYIAKQLGD